MNVHFTESLFFQCISFTSYILRSDAKERFTTNWLVAFDMYVIGNWDACRTAIELCLNDYKNDGPCQTMLRTIQHLQAPADWKGYRALTDK